MQDLETIAREPHPMGVSQAQADVRDYIMDEIHALGLEAQIQDTFGQRHWGPDSGYVSGLGGERDRALPSEGGGGDYEAGG